MPPCICQIHSGKETEGNEFQLLELRTTIQVFWRRSTRLALWERKLSGRAFYPAPGDIGGIHRTTKNRPASWCDFCSSPQPQSGAHFPPLSFPASAVSELLVMRKVHTDPHGRPSLRLSNKAFLLYSLGTTLPITEWWSVALRGGRSAVTLSSESCSLPTYCSLLLSDSLALIRVLIQS